VGPPRRRSGSNESGAGAIEGEAGPASLSVLFDSIWVSLCRLECSADYCRTPAPRLITLKLS
jgi:hypothetical protein